jgi:hypothetical protein
MKRLRKYTYLLNFTHASYQLAYEDGTDNVPKRWNLTYRRRGITQKIAYDIQNTAKV